MPNKLTDLTQLCVATRIHGSVDRVTPAFCDRVVAFVETAASYAGHVLIAVKVELTGEISGEISLYSAVKRIVDASVSATAASRTTVVGVSEWSTFTPALNALLRRSMAVQAKYILFQSLEMIAGQKDAAKLLGLHDECTLVVGAQLPGHDFQQGNTKVPINGRTVPWNTLALWNTHKLGRIGFPMVADGLIAGTSAGVEEVAAVSLIQSVCSAETNRAKIVQLDSINWDTNFEDEVRKAKHELKMQSKVSRPQSQMSLFPKSIDGVAEHVVVEKVGQKRKLSSDILTEEEVRLNLRIAEDSAQDEQKQGAQFETPVQKAIVEKKTVLVTGGAGFVGSHTSVNLLKRGDNVVIVDEMNQYYDIKQKNENLQWVKKVARQSTGTLTVVCDDICNADAMASLFELHGITHVVHLAARAGVRPSINDPLIYVHSNVRGTTTLLDIARKHNCKHFVYASSSSVYGGSNNAVFRETDIVDAPVSPYAATKKACELLAATYNHLYKMPTAGLRFFTVYGPRGRPDMAPYKFIHRIFSGITIDQYGDGSSERDYTYIDDIVSGVIGALDNPLGCQVYNLGNGRPISLKRFISIAADCAGKKAKINVMPMQPGDVPRTCANIDKAKKLIGYKPRVSFEEGMKRTAQWYKECVTLRESSAQ
jgi:UDP-glucuronate 4-epimerase